MGKKTKKANKGRSSVKAVARTKKIVVEESERRLLQEFNENSELTLERAFADSGEKLRLLISCYLKEENSLIATAIGGFIASKNVEEIELYLQKLKRELGNINVRHDLIDSKVADIYYDVYLSILIDCLSTNKEGVFNVIGADLKSVAAKFFAEDAQGYNLLVFEIIVILNTHSVSNKVDDLLKKLNISLNKTDTYEIYKYCISRCIDVESEMLKNEKLTDEQKKRLFKVADTILTNLGSVLEMSIRVGSKIYFKNIIKYVYKKFPKQAATLLNACIQEVVLSGKVEFIVELTDFIFENKDFMQSLFNKTDKSRENILYGCIVRVFDACDSPSKVKEMINLIVDAELVSREKAYELFFSQALQRGTKGNIDAFVSLISGDTNLTVEHRTAYIKNIYILYTEDENTNEVDIDNYLIKSLLEGTIKKELVEDFYADKEIPLKNLVKLLNKKNKSEILFLISEERIEDFVAEIIAQGKIEGYLDAFYIIKPESFSIILNNHKDKIVCFLGALHNRLKIGKEENQEAIQWFDRTVQEGINYFYEDKDADLQCFEDFIKKIVSLKFSFLNEDNIEKISSFERGNILLELLIKSSLLEDVSFILGKREVIENISAIKVLSLLAENPNIETENKEGLYKTILDSFEGMEEKRVFFQVVFNDENLSVEDVMALLKGAFGSFSVDDLSSVSRGASARVSDLKVLNEALIETIENLSGELNEKRQGAKVQVSSFLEKVSAFQSLLNNINVFGVGGSLQETQEAVKELGQSEHDIKSQLIELKKSLIEFERATDELREQNSRQQTIITELQEKNRDLQEREASAVDELEARKRAAVARRIREGELESLRKEGETAMKKDLESKRVVEAVRSDSSIVEKRYFIYTSMPLGVTGYITYLNRENVYLYAIEDPNAKDTITVENGIVIAINGSTEIAYTLGRKHKLRGGEAMDESKYFQASMAMPLDQQDSLSGISLYNARNSNALLDSSDVLDVFALALSAGLQFTWRYSGEEIESVLKEQSISVENIDGVCKALESYATKQIIIFNKEGKITRKPENVSDSDLENSPNTILLIEKNGKYSFCPNFVVSSVATNKSLLFAANKKYKETKLAEFIEDPKKENVSEILDIILDIKEEKRSEIQNYDKIKAGLKSLFPDEKSIAETEYGETAKEFLKSFIKKQESVKDMTTPASYKKPLTTVSSASTERDLSRGGLRL